MSPALRHRSWLLGLALAACLFPQNAAALQKFTLEKGQTLYGSVQAVPVPQGETLLDLARNYDLGYNQIAAANPTVDPWVPGKNTPVLVPSAIVLPEGSLPSGIVVNLAEMRLYYFSRTAEGETAFWSAPVGIGREGYETEPGVYTVRSKAKDPTWYIPPTVREEDPTLPEEVPPGPDNPLGNYILRFSRLAYGIHGTNRPWGVGRRVSHGCIRMYPEDIEALFAVVPVGTLISIVYEPIKSGWTKDGCWLQVFDDYEGKIEDPWAEAMRAVTRCIDRNDRMRIDFGAAKKALQEKTGVPVQVGWTEKPKS